MPGQGAPNHAHSDEQPMRGRAELLKKHVQALIEVELSTIPFYLTAVYSFSKKAMAYHDGTTKPLYDLQQKALSVAIQEMYHVQQACNLANSLNVGPVLPGLSFNADQSFAVPHVEPNGQPLVGQLGNLPAAIDAMKAIEQRDDNVLAQPNKEVVYGSIADLYHATWKLMDAYKHAANLPESASDDERVDSNNQIAYGTFATTYQYNEITTPMQAMKAINAITDQGEGQIVAMDPSMMKMKQLYKHFHPSSEGGEVRKEFQPSEGSRFFQYGMVNHYSRFEAIEEALNSLDWSQAIDSQVFYEDNGQALDLPGWAPQDADAVQESINTIWSWVIDAMQGGFNDGTLSQTYPNTSGPSFGDAMLSFKYTIPLLWQYGRCPSFVYRSGVSATDVQAAMDTVDPLCLFHWDAKTAELRADPSFARNACQGMNECAGKGWGGIATAKGNGACATVDLHTCGGNNSCKMEGGCGFLVAESGSTMGGATELLPADEQWVPGGNACAAKGGCQTPISTGQVFSSAATNQIDAQSGWNQTEKDQLKDLAGKGVWDRARELFATRHGIGVPEAPTSAPGENGIVYDGTPRREAIQPTSAT